MTYWDKARIELAFVREFSVHGEQLTRGSFADRVERTRVAILVAKREKQTFYDSDMTYAQAFRMWAGKPIELRRISRDEPLASHALEEEADTASDVDVD